MPIAHFNLRDVLKRYRGVLLMVVVFSVFSNLLMLVSPIYMLQIYDRVLTSYSRETLLALTAVALFLLFIFGGLEWARRRLMARIAQMLDVDAAEDVLNSVFRGRLLGAGQSINDFNVVRQFLSSPGIFAFFDAPWALVFTVVVFLVHPWLGWIALAGAVLLFILALLTEYTSRAPLRQAAEQEGQSRHFVNAGLTHADVLQAMGMFDEFREKWRRRREHALTHQMVAGNRMSLLLSMSKSLRFTLQVLILGVGAWLVLEQAITPGMMIAASIIMGRALAPIEQSISSWRGFVGARQSWQRLHELLATFPVAERAQTALPRPRGLLEAERLTVAAPGGDTPILHDVHFSFSPGTLAGVVGPSGSGKSTLARAILGIWPAASGTVRLDGAELDSWPQSSRRRHIGYLPQAVALFEGTVADNIARMGDVDNDKLLAAAQLAGCHDMIMRLPQHYETPLATGGANLSAGQRQRVAMAQAVYDDPALLVMDEPDANLDAEGQDALFRLLRELRARQITTVLITHNPRLVEEMTTLLLLRNGKVVMQGPSDSILARLREPPAVSAV